MPNNIVTAKKYVPVLDEIYKNAAKTSILDGASELAREGANAGELLVAKIAMQGLGDYSRTDGYVSGTSDLTWETIKADFDRGRKFSVDNLDNKETVGLAFGRLSGEFIRTKVVPELDAFRFAKYAGTSGVAKLGADLANGTAVLTALRVASDAMSEAEVPTEGRILFITPTLKGMVDDLDTTKSKKVFERFAQVIEVPQSRFYTAIEQLSGKAGEEAGGFRQATGAYALNFLALDPGALVQHAKHIEPKIIAPEDNQNADAWIFGYRMVSVAQAYENKVKGIYVHHGATAKV